MKNVEHIQRDYYTSTATEYDHLHVSEGDEHETALRYMTLFIDSMGIKNILDVGSGTGRAMRYFLDHHPFMKTWGVEPVPALIEQAVSQQNIPRETIIEARAEHLPFADRQFDAVCACALLHHVADPNSVVREMIRVASRAVFISDSNRFGQGSMLTKIIKLALYKSRLWNPFIYIRTKGKGYLISETDGLFYSYSVYDSLAVLSEWSDRILILPTVNNKANSCFHPLLTSPHLLVCAFRD